LKKDNAINNNNNNNGVVLTQPVSQPPYRYQPKYHILNPQQRQNQPPQQTNTSYKEMSVDA